MQTDNSSFSTGRTKCVRHFVQAQQSCSPQPQCSPPGAPAELGQSPTASAAANPDQKVELTYWAWAPNLDKVVDIWNKKNPNIQVTVNKQAGGDPAVTKLLTAVKAGSGAPDLVQAEYQELPTLVAADVWRTCPRRRQMKPRATSPDGVWHSVTLGTDALYSVPQDTGPMVFYYRADVFEKLGLAVPKTWDEYRCSGQGRPRR